MATGKALDGKPYAGNPHVRFDEGEVAFCRCIAEGCASRCATTPRRGALLHRMALMAGVVATCTAVGTAQAGFVIRPVDDDRAVVTSDGDDEVIIVKTNTTLNVSGSGTIDLLVVGGGGGGGARYGGGGGWFV